jgi:hypothetical protein
VVAIVRFKFIWLTLVGGYTCDRLYRTAEMTWICCSFRHGPHDHEHPCLLKMRQVQPSEWPGGAWPIFRLSGEEHRRSSGFANVESLVRPATNLFSTGIRRCYLLQDHTFHKRSSSLLNAKKTPRTTVPPTGLVVPSLMLNACALPMCLSSSYC